jgi:dTDP-4-dehydrorhamnose reductase
MIALFGSKGFVGSEILKSLKKLNQDVLEITRENFEENLGKEFEYVINAAMPAARYKAKNNPEWDFDETVIKTADIFYKTKFKKFIQISSISARCQKNTVYGRHKLAAEAIVDDGNSLIVRLGPMYGDNLKKGVLIDMLDGLKVYVGENSKYSFTPVKFIGEWVAKNLDKKGIQEVGAKNSISLKDLKNELGLEGEFEGEDDFQEINNSEPNSPDVNLVVDFMKNKMEIKNE